MMHPLLRKFERGAKKVAADVREAAASVTLTLPDGTVYDGLTEKVARALARSHAAEDRAARTSTTAAPVKPPAPAPPTKPAARAPGPPAPARPAGAKPDGPVTLTVPAPKTTKAAAKPTAAEKGQADA